jgi:hypothetical protein
MVRLWSVDKGVLRDNCGSSPGHWPPSSSVVWPAGQTSGLSLTTTRPQVRALPRPPWPRSGALGVQPHGGEVGAEGPGVVHQPWTREAHRNEEFSQISGTRGASRMIRWSISARRTRTSAMAPARRCVPRTRNRRLPVVLTDSRRDRAGSVRSVAIWVCGTWLSSDRSASSGSIARWMVRSGTASVTWILSTQALRSGSEAASQSGLRSNTANRPGM